MITFKNYDVIPFNWTGNCYIISSRCHCWFNDGRLHRLDGPARIYDGTIAGEYYINSQYFFYGNLKAYWNHPLVVNHTINKILEL